MAAAKPGNAKHDAKSAGPKAVGGGGAPAPFAAHFKAAVESYIHTHTHFRSSRAFAALKADLEAASTYMDVLLAPIKHKMFDLAGAIAFCFFLYRSGATAASAIPATAAATTAAAASTPDHTSAAAAATPDRLNLEQAFATISAIYDEAVRDDFDCHSRGDVVDGSDCDSDYADDEADEDEYEPRGAAVPRAKK